VLAVFGYPPIRFSAIFRSLRQMFGYNKSRGTCTLSLRSIGLRDQPRWVHTPDIHTSRVDPPHQTTYCWFYPSLLHDKMKSVNVSTILVTVINSPCHRPTPHFARRGGYRLNRCGLRLRVKHLSVDFRLGNTK